MNQTSQPASWKEAWASVSFRVMFFITFLVLAIFAYVFPSFFDFIEARNGTKLNDFILEFLPSADVSWVVFFFLYSGLFLAFYELLRKPRLFILALQTYILVTLMRMLSITMIPLNPPDGYIALKEPFVQIFTNDGRLISRDLFFSGHVSTICSALFCVRRPLFRWLITICAVMICILVLVQRVHYSVDVIVAPMATYGCYHLAKKIQSYFLSDEINLT